MHKHKWEYERHNSLLIRSCFCTIVQQTTIIEDPELIAVVPRSRHINMGNDIEIEVKKMSKTLRWFMIERDLSYNPFWSIHEDKIVRTNLHRASRHENRVNLSKDRDTETETKTCGWKTW